MSEFFFDVCQDDTAGSAKVPLVSWATSCLQEAECLDPYSRHALFLNNSFQIPRTHSETCPGAVCSALSASGFLREPHLTSVPAPSSCSLGDEHGKQALSTSTISMLSLGGSGSGNGIRDKSSHPR